MIWHTEKRKVNELKGNWLNPRILKERTFSDLKKSIIENGYVDLVTIDTDNTIISGHQRVKAFLSLNRGEEEIDVRVPERKLTKEESDRYLISANAIHGEFDVDLLSSNFTEVQLEAWGVDLSKFGVWNEEETEPEESTKNGTEKPKKEIICPHCGKSFIPSPLGDGTENR